MRHLFHKPLENTVSTYEILPGSATDSCPQWLGSIHTCDLLGVNYLLLNNGLYCTKWAHSHLLFGQLYITWNGMFNNVFFTNFSWMCWPKSSRLINKWMNLYWEACLWNYKLVDNGREIFIFSLHIRSMWETICDAWACWSGWNFGPNSTEYPYSEIQNTHPPKIKIWQILQNTPILKFRIPPQNRNLTNSTEYPYSEIQNTPPKSKFDKFYRIPLFWNSEYPPKIEIWQILQNTPILKFRIRPQTHSIFDRVHTHTHTHIHYAI